MAEMKRDEWERVRLGDVCDVRDGTHDSPKYILEGGYPLVTSKNIQNNTINLTDVNFISETDYLAINKRSGVDDGDILMPMIGTIGNPIIVKKTFDFAIKNLALIKFEESTLLNRYVLYLLSSGYFSNYILSENRGGTQKFLSLNAIRNFTFPLPPLDVQRRIAETLDKVTELISLRKTQLEKLDELVKARFVEMFGDLTRNPLNWDTFKLDDCFDITSSKRILKSEWKSAGIPFLRVRDMVHLATTRKLDNEFFVSEEFYASLGDSDGVPIQGDILVSATSTLGKCHIVNTGERFYFKDADVLRFRAKVGVNPIFFIEQMKTKYIEEQISKTLGITTVAHFTIKAAKTISIRYPNIELQNSFASFVSSVEETKAPIQQSLDTLETLKKSLMQEYFG